MKLLSRVGKRLNWEYLKVKDAMMSRLLRVPNVMSVWDTIEYVSTHSCSVSRFGDGEIGVMYGKDLNFQDYDPVLAEKMREILTSEDENLLVCIPGAFTASQREGLIETEQRFWKTHLMYFRRKWSQSLSPHNIYGNTWMSRIYSPYWNSERAVDYFTMLSTLWRGRDVVFVEGKYSRLGVGNDCFISAKSVRRIIGPAKNAFACYNELFEAAMAAPEHSLFLLALGPTATVLAADLSKAGRRAIDIGHLDVEYEWLRMKTRCKVPVKGKFVNEAFINGTAKTEVTGALTSEENASYEAQIIADIS